MTQKSFPAPRRPHLTVAGLVLLLAGLGVPRPAAADDIRFTLHAEPAAAFWVDDPQSEHFTPGFYGAIRPGVALGRMVSLQGSYAFLGVPAAEGFSEAGGAHFFTAGARLRPFALLRPETEQLGGLFVDLDLGYVRTGPLGRFGFDTGLGYAFQVSPVFALGPVLRYTQIVQPEELVNVDLNDAQFISLGLNLSFGRPHHDDPVPEPVAAECPEPEPVPAPEPPPPLECPAVAPVPVSSACPDGDGDGVCDATDRCPTDPGLEAAFGCPPDPCGGTPLLMLVQFPYDSSSLPAKRKGAVQTMDPVLDAVAAAIAQDPSCRVCIIGYASVEGPASYNLTLSRERAAAVSSYLTARGLDRSRLPATGFGETCQLEPESSEVLNRRVEFRRLDEGESCPTKCSP